MLLIVLIGMRVIVLIVVALLPVHECDYPCTTGTERTSANHMYSAGAYSVRSTLESACTAGPSCCFPYDWDETGDVGYLFKNDLSNATCVGCVQPWGLVAKKGCERFTSLAARLCCVSAPWHLCCLPIGFAALWVRFPPPSLVCPRVTSHAPRDLAFHARALRGELVSSV